jgi:hypothetical protein
MASDRSVEFVSSLVELSDYVLFSAAIPYQGGRGHVNEQWQHYWVKLFDDLDYLVHDFIRPRIWSDEQIPFWYRQNTLFFSKRQKSFGVLFDFARLNAWSMPLNLVHPDLYLFKLAKASAQIGVKSSFKLFCRSLKDYIRKKL